MKKGFLKLSSLLLAVCLLAICIAPGIRVEAACEHEYQSQSVVRPTCEAAGTITYECTKCGDTSKTLTQDALTHGKQLMVAKSAWSTEYTRKYHIFQHGQDYLSPFKFLNFGKGESCVVTLYIFNGTDQTLSNINLCYNFGIYAYASTDTVGTRIPGSYADLSLASGEGKTVMLSVPRSCYISNSSNKLTAGNDSLGELVSYQDLGLRINAAANVTEGEIYIACLSDSVVTETLAQTKRWHETNKGVQELVTDFSSDALKAVGKGLSTAYEEWYGSDYTCIHEAKPLQNSDEVINITNAQTWVANELSFLSTNEYNDPYNDVVMDMVITNGKTTYTVPCFWDGGATWKARFACPEAGNWTYTTVCSNTSDVGLHGRTGTVICGAYSGEEELYKHGFVQIEDGKRYFTYADGTTFFYLGDTHWHLGVENLEMLETILKQRKSQGYSVIQTQPRGEAFDLRDSVSEMDMMGFKAYDAKMKLIADYGFVNSCAEFFSGAYMKTFIENHGGWSDEVVGVVDSYGVSFTMNDLSDEAKAALEKLTRYWVARYGSYSILWTLGQEVDNDFYWDFSDQNGHAEWSYLNNPYKYMAEYIGKYDPYSHPLTAHMENTELTNASNSAFRDVEEHTWWAVQWRENSYSRLTSWYRPKDYWVNGQGKPAILYESGYCYLSVKNFGARVQSWMGMLNGMSGYAWGGHDIWAYTNTYNENIETSDGVDLITPGEKQDATWRDALVYESSYQMGYTREFFENIVGDWYNLIPDFDNNTYFEPDGKKVFYYVAANADQSEIVLYFYNFSDPTVGKLPNATIDNGTKTGTLKNMQPGAVYNYLWYNPIYGQIVENGTLTADANGVIVLPEKATCDMTLYISLTDDTCAHQNVVNYAAKEATCTQYGNTAFTFCVDCGKIITEGFKATAVKAHTPNAAATCFSGQSCTVCGKVIAEALDHDFEATNIIQPDCTNGGEIQYKCSLCGETKAFTTDKLSHTDFFSSLLFWRAGTGQLILDYGEDKMSPFKFLDFGDGDTCEVTLYIYNSEFNNAVGSITDVYLSYSWGIWAYADEESAKADQRIPGTCLEGLDIKPGTGQFVTLTIPRECYISNKPGALTDGGNDSRGQIVSYRDLGLRFDKRESDSVWIKEDLLTHVYVVCVDDPTVTACLSRTRRYINPADNQVITAVTNRPAQLVADLKDLYDNAANCSSGAQCVHCGVGIGETNPDKHTYNSDGVCTGCGAIKTTFSFYGANLTLGNVLDMNFAVEVSDITDDESYAVITRTYADGREPDVRTIPMAQWGRGYIDDGLYLITYSGLAPKEMCDKITITLYDKDDVQISDVWVDSIRDYAMRNIDKFEDKWKTLLVEMLNYGAASQTAYNYDSGNLANGRLTAEHLKYALEERDYEDQGVLPEEYDGLLWTQEFNVDVALKIKNINTNMRAVVSYTDHYGKVRGYVVQGADFVDCGNGVYSVKVNGLVIADASQVFTVTIYDGGTEVVKIAESLESRIARMRKPASIYTSFLDFADAARNAFNS